MHGVGSIAGRDGLLAPGHPAQDRQATLDLDLSQYPGLGQRHRIPARLPTRSAVLRQQRPRARLALLGQCPHRAKVRRVTASGHSEIDRILQQPDEAGARVANLAQPGRVRHTACPAGLCTTRRGYGLDCLPLTDRPLAGRSHLCGTLFSVTAGLYTAPHQVRSRCRSFLTQPLLQGSLPCGRVQVGQFTGDPGGGGGSAGPTEVDHVGTVFAVTTGVEPGTVVAAPVGARLTLDQAPPDQPCERLVDQGLAATLPKAVGKPARQQPRRTVRQRQQALQVSQLRLHRRLHLVLLPPRQPLPQPRNRPKGHPQMKISRSAHPPLPLPVAGSP